MSTFKKFDFTQMKQKPNKASLGSNISLILSIGVCVSRYVLGGKIKNKFLSDPKNEFEHPLPLCCLGAMWSSELRVSRWFYGGFFCYCCPSNSEGEGTYHVNTNPSLVPLSKIVSQSHKRGVFSIRVMHKQLSF